MPDLRVLIVADDPLARAGLAALLAARPDLVVVGQSSAGSTAALRDAAGIYRPDVLLWDLGWSRELALQQLAGFRAGAVPVAVLLPDGGALLQARVAWTGGARALLLRDSSPSQLASALASLVQGLIVLDPALAAALGPAVPASNHADWSPQESPLLEELTPRELEVLRLLAQGAANKAIAHALGISEHTVKFHVNAILSKLDVQSRTEAVVKATRLGLVLL